MKKQYVCSQSPRWYTFFLCLNKREGFCHAWVSGKTMVILYLWTYKHALESRFLPSPDARWGNWTDLLHSLIHLKIMDTCLQLALVHKINATVPATVSSTWSSKLQHIHSMTIFVTAKCTIPWLKSCVTMLKRGFTLLQIPKGGKFTQCEL